MMRCQSMLPRRSGRGNGSKGLTFVVAVAVAWFVFAEVSIAAGAAAGKQAAMTLDEIRIEGEIAMPQVLFVTSYEQLRFSSEAHRAEARTLAQMFALVPWPGVPWALGSERPLTKAAFIPPAASTQPAK